jgi:LPXTG-site transpeptidase (sortase) family protein
MKDIAHKKFWARTTGALAPVLRSRWRTILGAVLTVVGTVGLLVPFLSFSLAQPEDVLLDGQPVSLGELQGEVGSSRLLIPKVGISMPILTGDLNEALELGAWIGGAEPGEQGNAVIFGHRFKYLPPLHNTMFRLDGLEIGDTFVVRWHDVERTYRVTEKRVVEPSETSVVRDFGDERVTLITCTPVWSTSHRLVVVGIPVAN